MLDDSVPPDVPVLHDDDEAPPVRRLRRRFGVTVSEILRPSPKPSSPPRARQDSIRPVGITIPPPSQGSSGFTTFRVVLSETRALTALLSRLNRTGAVFGLAVVGLLVAMVVKGRAAKLEAARATADSHLHVAAALPAPAKTPPPPPQEATHLRALPPAQTVEIGLSSNAPAAQFRIDGGPWLPNPNSQQLPKDDREHRIEARADGYYPRFTTARFNDDLLVELPLEKIVACESAPMPVKPAKTKDVVASSSQAAQPAPAALPAAREDRRDTATSEIFRGGQLPVRPIEKRSPYE